MTTMQTFDMDAFYRRIASAIRALERPARYILLGTKEYTDLRVHAREGDYIYTGPDGTEKYRGIEVLCVNRESFFEVV